ncbi:MAG TPA: CTP synthase [Anaerohalosphaeraceae bacterium]|nr:CTP synthase [Phycisphaerae bacterium]HOK95833.1 CTP synthase [Anaerohalosphaeraceae bacterium]HOL31822.1 CTP synthase [Anaerohalosphaeraceae bacterium]HOM75490.1 CTP synthase [Anaerohalosphaeraceae bacterium]HPC63782.1 CTP synthase [Anaerohalosphaeraceae bacterium]
MSDSMDLLAKISGTSTDNEYFLPLPPGYQKGKTRYVIVMGTVMSGLGKGIFSSCLAKLLQDKGLTVAPIKLEGYLNIDSGTLNPFRHGEVFVLDDGMECDMDLGTYERMLDQNLSRQNFSTSGQIYSSVLEKERHGDYLGRDVQMIPHVTGEVKMKLRQLAMKTNADVVFVEIGGTVGDLENAFYIEAMRELAYEEGPNSCCFVALTYILEPKALGEQKSKAAQLGIKQLMQMGIQPDIIACRAEKPVSDQARQKMSVFGNVPFERVFSMHDSASIYAIPSMLRDCGIDFEVLRMLKIEDRIQLRHERKEWARWCDFTDKIGKEAYDITIGITGKYTSVRDSYASVLHAVEHAGIHLGIRVNIKWIETTDLTDDNAAACLADVDGIIVPGGFGTRGWEGKIACVHYARQNNVPYLGLCLGFQAAVIEFARNVCGLAEANSTEIDPHIGQPVISILPEQKKIEGLGGNMRLGGRDVEIKKDTMAWKLFGKTSIVRLRFRHRYEVDPAYVGLLEEKGLVFSGKAPNQPIMQILELPSQLFFMGTQAHPELTSRPMRPSPFFVGLVAAAGKRRYPNAGLDNPLEAVEKVRGF